MDITRLLEADHRQVEELFDQIDKAEGDERTPLIAELEKALKAHMELEEKIVYPKMAPVTGEEAVEEGNTEHELARKALADMVRLGPDEPGFGAALEATKAGIEHHVEEEEGEVFPQLRRDGEEALAEMATPFFQLRMELGLPMPAEALAKASSKDELVEEARNAGIDPGSKTKEELAEALSAAMAG